MNGIFYQLNGSWLCKICHARAHRFDCPIATTFALALQATSTIELGAAIRHVDLDLLHTFLQQIRMTLSAKDPHAHGVPRRRATDTQTNGT